MASLECLFETIYTENGGNLVLAKRFLSCFVCEGEDCEARNIYYHHILAAFIPTDRVDPPAQPAYAIMKQIQIYANLGKFKRQKYLNSNKGIIYFEFIKHYVKTVY